MSAAITTAAPALKSHEVRVAHDFNFLGPNTRASCGFKIATFVPIFSNSYKKFNLFSNNTS
jgi:hypothetical protein